MLSQLNHDIKLDNPTEKKTAKKDMLNDLKEHNLDKSLLKELRVSIADDASISGSGSASGGPRSKSNSGSSDDQEQEQEQFEPNHTETVSDLSDDANQSTKHTAKFVVTPVENTENIHTINPFDNILTTPITSHFVEPALTEESIDKSIQEIIGEVTNNFIENPEDTVNLLDIHDNIIT
jgi:hypothetical protein